MIASAPLLVSAYIGILLWQLPSILRVASWNADNANMLNLASDLSSLPGGEVVNMGNAPIYSTLWFNAALTWVPGGEHLLTLMPFIWYLLGAALLTWGVARTAGRSAAGVVAALLICLNPVSLQIVTSHAVHGSTWFTVAGLSAYAVFVATRSHRRVSAIDLTLACLAGLIAGVNIVSDPLALPVAVMPLMIAMGAVSWRAESAERSRVVATAGTFLAAALVAALATPAIGRATGITADLPPRNLATLEQIWSSLLQAAQNAMGFFGPAPFGDRFTAFGALRLAVGIIGLVGVVIAIRVGLRRAAELRSSKSIDARDQPLFAFQVYWGASLVVGLAVVVASPLTFEVRDSSVRYEFNLFFAAAVALAIWLRRRGPLMAAALISGVAIVGIGGVLSQRDDRHGFERSAMVASAPDAIDLAHSRGATRGYAGYWNAGPLRWHTGADLLPVANCNSPKGIRLCPTRFAVPPHRFEPRVGRKSYVLIDHAYAGAPEDRYLVAFGPWEERHQIGDIYLLIYSYDIASRFGEEQG